MELFKYALEIVKETVTILFNKFLNDEIVPLERRVAPHLKKTGKVAPSIWA